MSAPGLAPGVRLHHDRVRAREVLLAPERIVALDETAAAILALVDGRRGLPEIAGRLAADSAADPAEIEADAAALIADLAARGYVRP